MLLVFGSINIDFVFPVPHLPKPGDTVWAEGGRTQPGGRGANAAVAAAADGRRATFTGAVGTDVLGDAALAGLQKAGVALHNIARAPADTGRSAVCIDAAGSAMVVSEQGANAHARASQVDDSLLGPDTTLLVQLAVDTAETAALIARARARGCRIVLHAAPARAIATQALLNVDVLLGNSTHLAWLAEHLGTGNNPASLRAALGVTTIRTLGTQGAEMMSDDGFCGMQAFPVHALDPTGAGDCFAGVFAGAWGDGASLQDAMRRATVASALSTTRKGAQGGMPDAAAIDAALPGAPALTALEAEILG